MIDTQSSPGLPESNVSFSRPESSSKKIAEGRKRFRTSASRVPALILDADGTIRHVTPAARRLLEYGHDETVSPCFFSHVHGRNMYQVMRDVADMVCYGKPRANWLLRMRTGRGRWQWFRTNVTNQLDADVPMIKVVVQDLQEF